MAGKLGIPRDLGCRLGLFESSHEGVFIAVDGFEFLNAKGMVAFQANLVLGDGLAANVSGVFVSRQMEECHALGAKSLPHKVSTMLRYGT